MNVISDASNHRSGSEAVFETLAAAFGQPREIPGGFRWAIPGPESGREIVVHLNPPEDAEGTETLWVFDREPGGVASVFSLDMNSPDGMAWLRNEVHRLGAAMRRGSCDVG